VDQTVVAELVGCPYCGGEVHEVQDHEQFVVDLPEVEPTVTAVRTQSGYCQRCKRRVRSRHPAQVSSAGGAAKVSLGPRALGLAAELKHRQGMPYRDIAELFEHYFGLSVSHGALVHASVRLAQRGRASYAALCERVRLSAVVHTDDTGWRVDCESAWLWVFATAELTVYVVARSRGSDVVRGVLGPDFGGKLVSDGLPALDVLSYERSQCLGHLLRRACQLCAEQSAGAVRFPLAVKNLLQDVLQLREQRGQISALAFARRRGRLERRLDDLLSGHSTVADNQRLRRHMRAHRDQLLVCLYDDKVAPTNNLAEQQLRGAVVIRKLGGCNRSQDHARAHAVLASVAQTAHRHGLTLTDFVAVWMQPRDGPWDEVAHCLDPLQGHLTSLSSG
jgi:transposase